MAVGWVHCTNPVGQSLRCVGGRIRQAQGDSTRPKLTSEAQRGAIRPARRSDARVGPGRPRLAQAGPGWPRLA
eukprot:363477-Chlamydomonas_euryale.AAC.1